MRSRSQTSARGIALFACTFLLGIVAARAEEPHLNPPPRPVHLVALIREALLRNPGLQAKKRAYEAARARVISAWLPEDPAVGVDVEGQPDLFRFNRRTDREYMIMQTIPFPTTLIARRQLAVRDADIAFQQYKEE